MMFTDLTFVPLLEKIADKLPTIERYVILTDAAHMPKTTLKNAVAYEDWIAEVDGDFAWKSFDENTAAGMCYTSGTTGHPKGVRLFAPLQRAARLHGVDAGLQGPVLTRRRAAGGADVPRQRLVARLFHADGRRDAGACRARRWTAPRSTNCSTRTKCHFTAAVPTVWLMLLQDLEKTGGKLPHLKRVVIGGSACPRAMTKTFQDKYGVEVVHAWGMTEMSPLGSLCTMKPEYAALTGEARLDVQMKQGHPPFGVEMKITDDNGKDLPWDGKTFGRLKVRGPGGGEELLQGRRRRGVREGRLVRHRRRRDHGPIRLHADHRPRQGRDQVGRRMDFHRSTWKISRSAIRRWRKPP